MHLLEKAIKIALEAHEGQVDKAGKPYILHPLRLMHECETEVEMVAALLHDVLEDSQFTVEDLKKEGIPDDAIEIIKFLTKGSNESYDDFIKRISFNKIAAKIKVKDIQDNMNIARLESVKQKDLDRLAKYHNALMLLRKCL